MLLAAKAINRPPMYATMTGVKYVRCDSTASVGGMRAGLLSEVLSVWEPLLLAPSKLL